MTEEAYRRALQEPGREIIRALMALWRIAYRHMPNERHTLDQIGGLLEEMLERLGP